MKQPLLTCLALFSVVAVSALPAHADKPVRKAPPSQQQPSQQTGRPLLELVFVVDTTGSMGGLLEGAKQRVWGIVNDMMTVPQNRRPEVRVGLVAYRDLGDTYVTKVTPLTNDLDKIYSVLMDYSAESGGDAPENVRRALAEGVGKAGWSNRTSITATGRKVAQIIFLVGDAPPHNDYKQEPDVLTTAARAVERGIYINTIQCGSMAETKPVWQSIARRGEGQYFAIAQDGGVAVITTPYDAPLAKLGGSIGRTYIAYGGGAGRAGAAYRAMSMEKARSVEAKVSMAAAAAPEREAAAADRTVNKAVNAYAYDSGDLVTAIENKTTTFDKVKDADLPDDLKKLAPAERKAAVEKRLAERKEIRAQILTLSKKRETFLLAERKKQAAKTGSKTGFDTAVSAALKQQAAKRGISL